MNGRRTSIKRKKIQVAQENKITAEEEELGKKYNTLD